MSRKTMVLLAGVIVIGVLLAALLAPLVGFGRAPAATRDDILNAETRWYVDPSSNAAREAESLRTTRPEDAREMDKIASQPQADWFGEWSGPIREAVNARVSEIIDAGALPVLVAYNIPYRDCGQYSQGGTNDPGAYKQWIRDFAEGIGDRPAVVILEPDALPLTDCLTAEQLRERYDLLKFAIQELESRPQVLAYVDAGHSAWLPAEELVRRLTAVGIDDASGFSLNVSNFQPTDNLIAYGKRVSDLIGSPGGTHFVIDTSRNGNGPWSGEEAWCNPPERALGEAPTVQTADPLVDAYLWIKRPGESDGDCKGGPSAGTWWPDYALDLARRSAAP